MRKISNFKKPLRGGRQISKLTSGQSNMGKACGICGKAPVSSYNRPNSLHKTKRKVKPNLQKFNGKLICTRCLRACLKTPFSTANS